jgi:hypothetical protein
MCIIEAPSRGPTSSYSYCVKAAYIQLKKKAAYIDTAEAQQDAAQVMKRACKPNLWYHGGCYI